MTGWLIDINPRECPPDVMDAPEAYRAAWERHVGEAVPGDGDPEDWREQAARLEAAVRVLPDPHVRVAGRPYEGPDPMTLAHYGTVMLRPYMDQLSLPPSNADRYDLMPSLRPYLGRDARSVACDGDMIDTAVHGMLDRHPGSGVVAKFMLRSKRLPLAFIDPDGTFMQADEYGGRPERIPFAAWRWTGYDLALFEGEPDAARPAKDAHAIRIPDTRDRRPAGVRGGLRRTVHARRQHGRTVRSAHGGDPQQWAHRIASRHRTVV